MKKLEFWKYAALIVAALCMSFTFTSCDELFEDDDEEENESSEPQFSDYFSMEFTRCERVGDVLILDWTIKNKSKKDVQSLCVNMGSVWCHSTDDTGETYPYGDVSVGGSGSKYASDSRTFSILAGESVQGSIRINGFNQTNNATKFTLNVDVSSEELGVAQTLEAANIKITDNRVMSKGIQTNDTKLAYTVKSCTRDDEGNVIVSFAVKNNTGTMLKNYYTLLNNFSDNLGSYCSCWMSLSNDLSVLNQSFTINVEAGETQTYYIKISGISRSATSVNGSISMSSDSYDFEYYKASFYTIPIQ